MYLKKATKVPMILMKKVLLEKSINEKQIETIGNIHQSLLNKIEAIKIFTSLIKLFLHNN